MRCTGCRGQALVLVVGLVGLLLMGAGAVAVVGAGHVAAARAQRVADLAAVSAARGLLAELGRGADARGPVLAGRLRERIRPVVAGDARTATVTLPAAGPAGMPASVVVTVVVDGPLGVPVTARAHAGLRVQAGAEGRTGRARGGGYAGPLVYRDAKPVCPAVAGAFDLMDAAARRDGVDLVVVSGFRSDAEQAVLFARHPDPRWVAPPGRSRHRDATELDLGVGPPAWAWLRVNASRFGFVQRYSWEPWHYGFLPGCGAPAAPPGRRAGAARPTGGRRGAVGLWGEMVGARAGGSPVAAADAGGAGPLPGWVPVAYRDLVWRAAVAGGVPPVVLAALLQAESGWDPRAVSPAGARGIAQFMPATAAGMGLRDPFDPVQAIPAAGRLLGGHLRRFGSVPLALAAYNAGPGAVERYGGVPPYPETQGYVARITALAGGVAAPPVGGGGLGMEVVLLPMPARPDG